eukprot:TRINITY_DN6166_c0_g1_i3.p1 TRINITY_DN6166_c0_g1~~TRINITY_DN6166_c0_g1_i3.p1  ORF type:complete len:573 (-),score=141.77 TRINITY_DN6166_c0_g1_i3:190-1908(-)
MWKYMPLAGLGVALVSGQYDYVSECPEDNGIFADALQCDRYYECQDGVVSEQFCPDGLVFDEASSSYAKCGFPFAVDCTGRDERQPANPTPGCPHQHGYFAVPDKTNCNKFNFCVDGVPNTITCAGGLIFDPEKGQCAYSDQTNRPGCTSGDLYGFRCPEENLGAQGYSRHSDPEDCQFFYLCIEGKARRNGCSIGDVFDPVSLSCQRQDKVDGPCGNWYNQTFIESLNQPKPKPSAITANRVANQENRRRPSRPALPRRQQVFEEQIPEKPLPQQLADLERFGQPKANQAPSFGQNFPEQSPVNNRETQTGGRGRVRSQVPRRPAQQQQVVDTPRLQSDERQSFFNNLRSATRQEATTQRSFTRPPRRRPAQIVEAEPQVVESPRFIEAAVPAVPAQDQNFGQRQNFQSRRKPVREQFEDSNNGKDLLEQVEEELARREQNSNQNLGPSDLDSLQPRNQPSQQEEPILPEPVSRQRVPVSRGGAFSRGGARGSVSRGGVRRVPVSRGGGSRRGGVPAVPQESEDVEALGVGRQTSRGRLQVIENRRPPLQRFEEDETEFENVNTGRQRNRG